MTTALSGPAPGVAQRVVLGETLAALAAERDDILVLDGDLANSTRTDIVATRVPDRFLQMGIAEQNMVGVAAGLAAMGFVPFVTSFASFVVARALDQIRVTVAQPGLGVKLVGGYAGILTGSTGKTHQLVDDLAIMRAMPGMTVLAPADEVEAAALIRHAVDIDGPVYIRLARDPVAAVFSVDDDGRTPRVRAIEDDGETLVISTGTQTSRTAAAVRDLRSRSVSCALLHVSCIKPLDREAILRHVAGRRLVITTEEHTVVGGLGGAVAEVLAEEGGPPLRRIGIDDVYGQSGPNDALLDRFGLSTSRIADRIAGYIRAIDR